MVIGILLIGIGKEKFEKCLLIVVLLVDNKLSKRNEMKNGRDIVLINIVSLCWNILMLVMFIVKLGMFI